MPDRHELLGANVTVPGASPEQRDLLAAPLSPDHAQALDGLRAQLALHVARAPQYERVERSSQPPASQPPSTLDRQLRESLRRLGYLE